MTTITELHETVQTLPTSVADTLGRNSGFIRRQRQLSGASFAQTLILGSVLKPNASRDNNSSTRGWRGSPSACKAWSNALKIDLAVLLSISVILFSGELAMRLRRTTKR